MSSPFGRPCGNPASYLAQGGYFSGIRKTIGMADYIYTLEIRLTPDQLRGVTLVQDAARAAGMNVYLTGGAVRDIISGFTIRDLDFTVQGNPLKIQKELEKAGAKVQSTDDDLKILSLT